MYRESEIEKLLVSKIQELGGRSYKWESPGNSGVPDRIVIFQDGRLVFVELKTRKGRLTENQKMQIRRLRGLGQTVYAPKGIQGLIDFFNAEGKYLTADSLMKRLESDLK